MWRISKRSLWASVVSMAATEGLGLGVASVLPHTARRGVQRERLSTQGLSGAVVGEVHGQSAETLLDDLLRRHADDAALRGVQRASGDAVPCTRVGLNERGHSRGEGDVHRGPGLTVRARVVCAMCGDDHQSTVTERHADLGLALDARTRCGWWWLLMCFAATVKQCSGN